MESFMFAFLNGGKPTSAFCLYLVCKFLSVIVIDELPPVDLVDSLLDFRTEPLLPVPLFNQPQPFADDLTGGLVFAAFHLALHKAFQFGCE